jgi:AcrR family transcriptional regulator
MGREFVISGGARFAESGVAEVRVVGSRRVLAMADPASTRQRPGRPAQLSRERIVDAALSSGNLETLTMRDLAAHLGVAHSALYRWVANRDALFDLVNEVIIERVVPEEGLRDAGWQGGLAAIAWAMHDHFLAVPGFATRISRPHRHTTQAFGRLRNEIITAFRNDGVDAAMAEQSWYIYITTVVSWLAVQENPLDLGDTAPRFELFLDALLRGLPAREPGIERGQAAI